MRPQDCIIQFRKPARRSGLTLEQVLQSKNDMQNILNEALCIEGVKEADAELLDSYLIRNLKGRRVGDELLTLIFEVYLKIDGFDLFFERLAISDGLYEKHNNDAICGCGVARICNGNKCTAGKNKSVSRSGFVYEKARAILSERHGISKLSVLAYVICLNASELYEGEYEVYYILDYILKERVKSVTIDDGTVHYATCAECNDKSIKLRDDVKIEHISYKINETSSHSRLGSKASMRDTINNINRTHSKPNDAHTRVCYHSQGEIQTQRGKIAVGWAMNCKYPFKGSLFDINCKSFFEIELLHLNDIHSLIAVIAAKKSHKLLYERLDFILKNKNKNYFKLSSLLTNSYSNDINSIFYTEKIMLRVADDSLVKQFILQTHASLKCFFKICTRVDASFMQCMNLCIDHFEEIPDDILNRMLSSERFKVETFQAFKKIAKTIVDRKVDMPIGKLLSVRKYDRHGKTTPSSSLRFNSWKVEVLHRINHILDLTNNEQSIRDSAAPFLKKAVSWDHPEISLGMIFRIENYKAFKQFISQLKTREDFPSTRLLEIVLKELRRMEYSTFYYKVNKQLLKMGLLKNNKDLLESQLGLDNSPISLAILHKLTGIDQGLLPHGLYFHRSLLAVSEIHSKFVLGARMVLFMDYLKDMTLLRLENGALSVVELVIDSGDIKIKKREIEVLVNTIWEIKGKRGETCGGVACGYNTFEEEDKKHASKNSIDSCEEVDNINTEISGKGPANINIEVDIQVQYEHSKLKVSVNSKEVETKASSVSRIEINESFYGVLKSFIYAETTEKTPVFCGCGGAQGLFSRLKEYANEFIVPVNSLLEYKNRKGAVVDRKEVLYLGNGNCGFIEMKNVLEHI